MTSDLSSSLSHGTTVYSTVICSNGGELTSSAHTDGVTVVYQAPSSEGAYMSITSPSHIQYPSRHGYLPTAALAVRWDGFAESASTPLEYEVGLLEEGSTSHVNWTNLSTAKMLSLSDLELAENVTHMIRVRAVNLGGVASDPVATNFSISSSPPQDTGK